MRMQGLEKLVGDVSHRKELVAGNLSEYITAQFYKSAQRVGDDAGDFEEIRHVHSVKKNLSVVSILRELMHELPQIIFVLYVVQKSTTILLSLASFILIEYAFRSFMPTKLFSIKTLAKQFTMVRKLYEIENVENKVVDGVESFPENQQTLRSGVSVEFRLIGISRFIQAFLNHVCQECIVPVPWCRVVCSPKCIIQDWCGSTLRHCWNKRLWKEHDLETYIPHLRPNRRHHPHRQSRHQKTQIS
ncbi:hypothetical protein DFJ58DRAFT_512399 [Suillus subalutaceus]|uniref:uncharacterized protein n=1 Tax=Suillus subalutaceus TaxID=48586 RepID=UPI001B882D11|nr:uncharacterized protein DFJ58DRAFT_512399 [Suillus subalutaceus]KAG1845093.1 hypothetical protein DFJ58DRAFT_512399 [Suillus subalutaceus]